MISAIKYCYTVCLIVVCANPDSLPQELEKQYDYAYNLYNNEEYFSAVTEFKRLIFFDSAGVYRYKANYYIGRSYKAGARFSDAIQYFTIAVMSAKSKEEITATKIEIVKSNILRRTLKQAHSVLDELEHSEAFIQPDEINYWRGWIYMFNDEWDIAAECFRKTSDNAELTGLALRTHDEKYSVTKAKVLSFILPGAGQFYTGDYASGVLSLGWNVLWGYLTINSFVGERIFDGFAVANFLWLRFYNGNIKNSEKFAIEKNIKISNQAYRYLKYEYRGKKPED